MTDSKRRVFRVKPDFFSFTSMAFVIGLCGGVIWGVVSVARIFFDIKLENPWLWSIAAFVGLPIMNAVTFFLFAVVGYPIFRYWRRNGKGIRIEGEYVELDEHNNEVQST